MAEEAAAEAPPEAVTASAPDALEETEEEALARLGLPDPDTLGEGDDFSAFMQAGVPPMLRRRALRKLWGTNPVLANVDGLVDYGEDFAAADLTPDVVATAYRVGKGFLKQAMEAGSEAEDETSPANDHATDVAVGFDDERGELSHPESDPAPVAGPVEAASEEEIAFRPRRMRFRADT